MQGMGIWEGERGERSEVRERGEKGVPAGVLLSL